MRSLVEEKGELRKDVVMAATVDEETGSHCGIIPLLEKKVLRPGFACVMDSTEFDAVIAQKGMMHARMQIIGKKAHGAYNWRGESAIEKAAEIIHKLKKLKFKFKKHPNLRGPTINIGTICGGEKVNMVCDLCEFSIDFRFPPGMDPKAVIKRFKSTAASVTPKFKFIIDDLQMPYEISREHPGIKCYMKTAKRLKCPAKFKGSEGATVITLFQKYKIPAFATGWGAHGTMHANDEYIFIKSLYNGTKLLEEYIKEYDKL